MVRTAIAPLASPKLCKSYRLFEAGVGALHATSAVASFARGAVVCASGSGPETKSKGSTGDLDAPGGSWGEDGAVVVGTNYDGCVGAFCVVLVGSWPHCIFAIVVDGDSVISHGEGGERGVESEGKYSEEIHSDGVGGGGFKGMTSSKAETRVRE